VSIARQCELLGLSRSTYYHQAVGESSLNQRLMQQIETIYAEDSCFGARRICARLRQQGYVVNRKRIARFMQKLGLVALYPKPRLSQPGKEHTKYPYLLRNLSIDHANQVWCTDITYIRLKKGVVYLIAIMDWYSRYVLNWAVSTTMETSFCREALERALEQATPEIFNSDQGAQLTSQEFTDCLKNAGIAISMDGRGAWYDNVLIERLWRSVKWENVYLYDYEDVVALKQGLRAFFLKYNTERPHQGLAYATPAEVYFGSRASMKQAQEGLTPPEAAPSFSALKVLGGD